MFAAPPSDVEALHAAIFSGAILRFRQHMAMRALVDHGRAFLAEALAPHEPVEVHRHLDRAALAEKLLAVQRGFSNDPQVKRLWGELFAAYGLDPADTARDRLMLRFQPPVPPEGGPHRARSTATVGFHRDSWGTNLYAQVNWWAPLYPISAGRTFAFLPHLFDRPLANDSAAFDLAQVMRHNRSAPAHADRKAMTPRLREAVDMSAAVPVVIDPGDVIAFSTQHAHVGLPNHTDLTRISLETRTLRLSDYRAGRGAPNVDGRARWIAFGMFRRISDGAPLADLLGVEAFTPFADSSGAA